MGGVSGVLVGIGAVGILAALVGGGLKASGMEVPLISTKSGRLRFGGASFAILCLGLIVEWLERPSAVPIRNDPFGNQVVENSVLADKAGGSGDRSDGSNTAGRRRNAQTTSGIAQRQNVTVSSVNQSGGVTAGEIGSVNQVNK